MLTMEGYAKKGASQWNLLRQEGDVRLGAGHYTEPLIQPAVSSREDHTKKELEPGLKRVRGYICSYKKIKKRKGVGMLSWALYILTYWGSLWL